MKNLSILYFLPLLLTLTGCSASNTPTITLTKADGSYNIVDTNQQNCYDKNGSQISCKNSGQDGEFYINMPSFTKYSNKTVTDNITGLTWQQSTDINNDGQIDINDKMTQREALRYCSNLSLSGFNDWRLPNIKTLYSLIDFSGEDIDPRARNANRLNPFIDNNTFEMGYGDTRNGERIIDAQWATSTNYVSTTMHNHQTMFGVNFTDGRIKGYPTEALRHGEKTFYVQCVRGNQNYGKNKFQDNQNGTITDTATNLIWQKNDNKKAVEFEDALRYCKTLNLAGLNDWRVPNAKELQSIVDYTKSPDTTNSAAIDTRFFQATPIINEAGKKDYGAYWSSTTHKNMRTNANAIYINFGESLGYFHNRWMDVHGAGAQRSDPKTLNRRFDRAYREIRDMNGNKTIIHGPQGDVVRGKNFVRCVR